MSPDFAGPKAGVRAFGYSSFPLFTFNPSSFIQFLSITCEALTKLSLDFTIGTTFSVFFLRSKFDRSKLS